MYEFIKTDEQPFLAEMTTCYEVLCAAVERARNASEAALKVREQSAAEYSLALQRRTKRLTGRQVEEKDEIIRCTETLIAAASAREQAAKLPLMNAIKETKSLLGKLDGVYKTPWSPWQRDAFEINTICLVRALKVALVVFEKIWPPTLRTSKVKLYDDYVRACEFAHFVPFFPHDVASNIGACELLITCLLDANRSGRKYHVQLPVADGQAVSLAEHYLRLAGWSVKVVGRRFELIPPARFPIELNSAPTFREEGVS